MTKKVDTTQLVAFIYRLGWMDSANAHHEFYKDTEFLKERGLDPTKYENQYKTITSKYWRKQLEKDLNIEQIQQGLAVATSQLMDIEFKERKKNKK